MDYVLFPPKDNPGPDAQNTEVQLHPALVCLGLTTGGAHDKCAQYFSHLGGTLVSSSFPPHLWTH